MVRLEMAHFVLRLMGAAALALAGLGPLPADAAETWKHGIVEAKGDSGFLFMSARRGFAERHGIDLEMVQFVTGTTATRAILAGELDSLEGSPVVALAAMAQGADMKIIGCHWPVMTYTLFSAADIASPEDLRGKTVGISSPSSLPALFAIEALASFGLTGENVAFANAGSSADRFRAVAAGVVAAAASSSEFEVLAEEFGVKALLRGADITPDFLRTCMMSTAKIIEARRDTIEHFLAAEMEALDYALENREETIILAREVAGLRDDDQSPVFVYSEVIRHSAVDPTLSIYREKVQWSIDMMRRHGIIRGEHNAADFIDGSVREGALRILDR